MGRHEAMKTYSKVGGSAGRPAYRTPVAFRYRKYVMVLKGKLGK